jgi:hypothetical protein
MALDSVRDAVEAQETAPNLNNAEPASAQWNGKEVQRSEKAEHHWIVLILPIILPPPRYFPLLEERVIEIYNDRFPTVEQVLERNNLRLASRSPWEGKAIQKIEKSDRTWLIPSGPVDAADAPSLAPRAIEIDANDYRNVERVLEQNGIRFAPASYTAPFFSNSAIV